MRQSGSATVIVGPALRAWTDSLEGADVASSDIEQVWHAIESQIARRDPFDLTAHPFPASLTEWIARASLAMVVGAAALWAFTLPLTFTDSTTTDGRPVSAPDGMRWVGRSPQGPTSLRWAAWSWSGATGRSLLGPDHHGDRLSTPLSASRRWPSPIPGPCACGFATGIEPGRWEGATANAASYHHLSAPSRAHSHSHSRARVCPTIPNVRGTSTPVRGCP